MGYIIQNKINNELAWNDTSRSWETEDFDTFNTHEKQSLSLPKNGRWVEVMNKCDEEEA